ncbi:MAG: transglutaminase [Porticoccaceae bacterium]|nr:MAG: transglutaminase [Porticoccaceae bacterium]
MRYRVRHTTRYRYAAPVVQGLSVAWLLPRDTARQRCLEAALRVEPAPATLRRRTDYFGNLACHIAVEVPHQVLEVTAESLIEVASGPVPGAAGQVTCGEARRRLMQPAGREDLAAREFLLPSPLAEPGERLAGELVAFARPWLGDADRPLLEAAAGLTSAIHRAFTYDPHFSDVATPLEQVFAHRRGVCQDFAHLAIACLRAFGLAARYVSGYIETLPPPSGEKLRGADASHAWFAVYVPGGGWFEFDPTNDLPAAERHLVVAWGRDYADVPPLRGVVYGGGGEQTLEVEVDVVRVA